ncbi:MAG: hypothetical protein KGP12_00040 [Actinomycetales bacterium]|nr:hypothetical protein [Actinomycetales bacterium]
MSQDAMETGARDEAVEASASAEAPSPQGLDDDGVGSDDGTLILRQEGMDMVLPVWEPTGDPEVDAALDELAGLDDLPAAEHAGVFDSVHRRLHGRLSGLASGA